MIAFDTNHLLRHILQDEPKQCKQVAKLLAAAQQVLILDLVIMETCWVLTKVYRFEPDAWCHVLESLLSDSAFCFENSIKLRRALDLYKSGGADFNDYLILASAQHNGAALETFDKQLQKSL